MRVSIIVAVSQNGVIGKNNDLIWRLPKDMAFFKEKTNGHHVIMGRKNFESIPHKYRPLPNRENIIITRNPNYIAKGCIIVHSIKEALKICRKNQESEPFIIGGGEIYKEALEQDLVDRVYLTRINYSFKGDTFFSDLDNSWKEIDRKCNPIDNKHAYSYDFITLDKIRSFTKKR